MVPYYYRKLMKAGAFNGPVNMRIWKEEWPALQEHTMASLRKAIPVDVSPITHILTQLKLPNVNLFPPWDYFYFELAQPYAEEYKRLAEREGRQLEDASIPDGVVVEVIKHDHMARAAILGTQDAIAIPAGYAYRVTGIAYKIGVPLLTHESTFFVGGDGQLVSNEEGKFLMQIGAPKCDISRLPPGRTATQYAAGVSLDVRTDLSTVIRFVSFMQARNIKAKRKHFPDYKPRKHQRHKIYKYYELTVVKPSINAINQEHGEGVKGKALHSVRGYVRHYTKEKPLFGRLGLHGDFFIPQHVRGNIQDGEVKKSYATKGR